MAVTAKIARREMQQSIHEKLNAAFEPLRAGTPDPFSLIAPGKRFPHVAWTKLVDQTFDEITKLATLKGGEYSGDVDRLANFRRNGVDCGLPMETVWRVYAGKHWDSITQFVKDLQAGKTRERLESLEGRADDLIVYLILFKAMLMERNTPYTNGG